MLNEQGQPHYVVSVPTLPEQERIEEEKKQLYRDLGRATGIDVDAMEAEIEAERAAEEAAEEAGPSSEASIAE